MHFEVKRVHFAVKRRHAEVVKFMFTGGLNGLLTLVWKVEEHWLSAVDCRNLKTRRRSRRELLFGHRHRTEWRTQSPESVVV